MYFNQMIVISDTKFDQETYHLKNFIIFEEYEKIPDKVKNTLENYDDIHQKLFKNFDIEKLDKLIKDMSTTTVNELLN